jgi:hypothetical protein
MPDKRWVLAFALLLSACHASSPEPNDQTGDPYPQLPVPREGSGFAPAPASPADRNSGVAGAAHEDTTELPSIQAGTAGAAAPSADDEQAADDERDETVLEESLARSDWEDFKARSSHIAEDGSVYYLVERDIPLNTERELPDYYDAMVAGDRDKGVVFLIPGTSNDDVWQGLDKVRLRYCIDTNTTTGFGAPSSDVSAETMIAAMEEATRAWHRVANVYFEYDPSKNDDCGPTASVPDSTYFKIARNESLPTVISFTASYRTSNGQDGRTIGVPSDYIKSLAPPGFTWPGTMMHELGHMLGLAHEHFHTNGGNCATTNTRNATEAVDLTSIMGYLPGGCVQTTPNLTELSFGDGWTMRSLYGAPPAWHPVLNGMIE